MSGESVQTDPPALPSLKRILVVGDWVIDDHWVTGIHRSPTSSRTGKQHFRALHLPGSAVQSLGIAGRTASVLYRTMANNKTFCELACVGFWHRDDTDAVAAMLDPLNHQQQTPYSVTSPKFHRPPGVRLFNLSDMLPGQDDADQQRRSTGTTRVIRIYQNIGTKIELIQRIDWERRPPVNGWISDSGLLETSGLKDYLTRHAVDAVVIKDISKGVVSAKLVGWLAANIKGAKWFVSSKAWNPDWLDELRDVDVRLLLIPPVAAQRAIQEGFLSCWTTRKGYLSREAFHEIDQLGGKFHNSPRLLVVALPDASKVIARDMSHHPPTKHERRGMVQSGTELLPLIVEVPMASVFFSAAIAHILENEGAASADRLTTQGVLQGALRFTREWMQSEVKRIEKPEDWNPAGEPRLELPPPADNYNVGKWQAFDWDLSKARWKQALNSLGVIGRDGKKYLELWRAMIDVDGYVCCVESRRHIIREVLRELRSFIVGGRQHHKSFMLIASPGSGKTYLASCLARSLGMHMLSFNITQMVSRNDLFDCFDTITTTQAQMPGRPLLVFVDEINAELEGQQVYGTFLAPIQEGAYVKAGKTFHIDPCAWIFAGTENPDQASGAPGQKKANKGSDFVSRLTLPPRDLRKIADYEEAQERTEKVYLGVSLIRYVFPDVLKVSEPVLQLFHALPKKVNDREVAAREIEHFVKSFVHVQYSEVLSKNIPTDDERFKGYIPDFWDRMRESEREGERIEIRMLG